jgi:hypothetical protein
MPTALFLEVFIRRREPITLAEESSRSYAENMTFKFLPPRSEPIDYYGPHRVINTWQSVERELVLTFAELYGMAAIKWRINFETQDFWDFFITFQQLPMPSNGMTIGCAGTAAMKKGKAMRPEQERALLDIGFVAPTESEPRWTIELSENEREIEQLAPIIIHIMDYGYGFNPNFLVSSDIVDVFAIDTQ